MEPHSGDAPARRRRHRGGLLPTGREDVAAFDRQHLHSDGPGRHLFPHPRRPPQARGLARGDLQRRHGPAHARPRPPGDGRRHGPPSGDPAASQVSVVAYDFRDPHHLPNRRPDGRPATPDYLPRQRRGAAPGMYGRYPDYDVLENSSHWDGVTRQTVLARIENPPPIRFFTEEEAATLGAFCDTVTGQDREPKIPVVNFVDEKMHDANEKGLDGYQHASMPDDRETWRFAARGLDEEARSRGQASFHETPEGTREEIVASFADGDLSGDAWDGLDASLAWSVVMRSVLAAFYSHPWAWNEIGYGGPAYPRGFMRLETGQKEPWEADEALDADPVADVAPHKAGTENGWEEYKQGAKRAAAIAEETRVKERTVHDRGLYFKRLLKGAVGPKDNDSRFLLDVHTRGLPGRETMRRYRDEDPVDLIIVGCGAGGGTLAQRLSRAGWRVVVLDAGPFWDPDRDWVSDEKGSSHIYWNEKRIIGGKDPVELGKNNSGRGVGGSMVHYAGYCPRFHPSDFETHTLDGVGADWPISYWDLKPHYERVEAELPVAGQDWPWGVQARRRVVPALVANPVRQALVAGDMLIVLHQPPQHLVGVDYLVVVRRLWSGGRRRGRHYERSYR